MSVASCRRWMGFLRSDPLLIYGGLKASSARTLGYNGLPQFLFSVSFSDSDLRLRALISAFRPVCMDTVLPPPSRSPIDLELCIYCSYVLPSILRRLYAFVSYCVSYYVSYSRCGPTSCRYLDRVFFFVSFRPLSGYPCLYTDQILPTHMY